MYNAYVSLNNIQKDISKTISRNYKKENFKYSTSTILSLCDITYTKYVKCGCRRKCHCAKLIEYYGKYKINASIKTCRNRYKVVQITDFLLLSYIIHSHTHASAIKFRHNKFRYSFLVRYRDISLSISTFLSILCYFYTDFFTIMIYSKNKCRNNRKIVVFYVQEL